MYCPCRWREPTRACKRRNPEKVQAHRIVRRAVQRGDVVRQPFPVCGAVPDEGHHEDYASPLDVKWLCAKHYAERHTINERKQP